MLYKFKSQATADVIMLEVNGRQLLEIIGKQPGPHGIITAAQVPAAGGKSTHTITNPGAAKVVFKASRWIL